MRFQDYPASEDEFLRVSGTSGAIFSRDERHRYMLWREWDQGGQALVVIGLNPSTATHEVNDPTIRRCMGFAETWGYGALVMVNLFAFRSTNPKGLRTAWPPAPDGRHGAVGLRNDAHLRWWTREANRAGLVLAAWGTNGAFLERGASVARTLQGKGVDLQCFAVTKGGHPIHPLYQLASALPVPYLATSQPPQRAGEGQSDG